MRKRQSGPWLFRRAASAPTLLLVREAEGDQRITLSELLAAFSLATDLGLGQPMEHVLRAWRIAARLGAQVGLSDQQQASLYYTAVLAWVGCVADTPEVARWFGDDIAFRGDGFHVDFSDVSGLPALGLMLGHVGAGRRPWDRVRLGTHLVVTGGKAIRQGLISHCLTTSRLAEQLGLDVGESLRQFFTRWDGSGLPPGVGGDQIALSIRLFQIADIAEVFARTHGLSAAVDVARARRGTQFDPALVDLFCARATEILDDHPATIDWPELIAAEPTLGAPLGDQELDTALTALADFIDLRSPCRAGHSRRVAELAASAAAVAGLPAAEVDTVRRAGLVHDIGLQGVPSTILDKPGPLTATETERMRLHAYYTERVLARPAALARIGAVASRVRERLDGSGYHRGLSGPAITAPARILAAADSYAAMTEPRPYREALTPKQAATQLHADVKAMRLAPDAVDAVLVAAGAHRPRRPVGPAGLTPREIEVLCLIARGASTRQVARTLDISPKTAGTHIERIYTKTGSSTRSTVTLFALQNGLLSSLEPLQP